MLKKISPLLLLCSFELFAANLRVAPQANDDYASVIVGTSPTVSINLSTNDRYGSIVSIDGSTRGQYGFLQLSGNSTVGSSTPTFGGLYIYTLYDNSTNAALTAGQTVTDTFTYTYANDVGQSVSAHLYVTVTGNQQTPVAMDDNVTVLANSIAAGPPVVVSNGTVTGNVSTNDKNGKTFYLNSSPASQYGTLFLNSDGTFTYTVYKDAPSINKLKAGEVVTDSFSYTNADQYGQSATAKVNVKIIGNPVDANGKTVFEKPSSEPYDNVEVEFNDTVATATTLNSGRNIKGSMYGLDDKDWYKLQSSGNEIIKIEVCPAGSSCFGKKNWVLYVFDSDKITTAMEQNSYSFKHWLDDTGTTSDQSGVQRLSATAGSSNHMYLGYRLGYFSGALIDIVDPCFDTSSSLEIGVGSGARNYLIAISTPLQGDGKDDAGKTACGVGNIVLRKAGVSVSGKDGTGADKTYKTTEEYITAFPYSDDQYAIKITGTGLNPAQSTTALARSATFNANTGELNIPKLRVLDGLYDARLTLQNQLARTNQLARSASGNNGTLKFALADIRRLGSGEITDASQATYNPANQQVIIPVTDTVSGKAYSVTMQYHPEVDGNAPWLEVVNSSLIQ